MHCFVLPHVTGNLKAFDVALIIKAKKEPSIKESYQYIINAVIRAQ